MGSLIVGPYSQEPSSTFDVGEMIRRKRLRDIFGLARDSTVTDQTPEGLIDASPAVPAGPVTNPSLYKTPDSTTALKNTIQAAPDISRYHPGRVRDIFSRIAGVGAGLQGGLEAGDKARTDSYYEPFKRQMGVYQQKVAQAKAVSDIDQSIQESQQKGMTQAATISHLEAQSKAEEARGNAELARALSETAQRLKLQRETDLLAPDHATAHKEKLEEINAQHPDNAKTPFEIWRTQHPTSDVSEWLALESKNKPEAVTEFRTFADGYKGKHPNATGDEVATAYSNATQKPPQIAMVVPTQDGGGRVVNARPGTVLPPGAMTPQQQGTMNVPTAATRTMAEAAPKVSVMADRVSKLVDAQVSQLGPAKGRWNEMWTGKVGTANPEFKRLMTDTSLLSTMLMRMHVGARGGEKMMEHFMALVDAGKDSPENMKAALEEIKLYADEVSGLAHPSSSSNSPANPQPNPKDPLGILGGK